MHSRCPKSVIAHFKHMSTQTAYVSFRHICSNTACKYTQSTECFTGGLSVGLMRLCKAHLSALTPESAKTCLWNSVRSQISSMALQRRSRSGLSRSVSSIVRPTRKASPGCRLLSGQLLGLPHSKLETDQAPVGKSYPVVCVYLQAVHDQELLCHMSALYNQGNHQVLHAK